MVVLVVGVVVLVVGVVVLVVGVVVLVVGVVVLVVGVVVLVAGVVVLVVGVVVLVVGVVVLVVGVVVLVVGVVVLVVGVVAAADAWTEADASKLWVIDTNMVSAAHTTAAATRSAVGPPLTCVSARPSGRGLEEAFFRSNAGPRFERDHLSADAQPPWSSCWLDCNTAAIVRLPQQHDPRAARHRQRPGGSVAPLKRTLSWRLLDPRRRYRQRPSRRCRHGRAYSEATTCAWTYCDPDSRTASWRFSDPLRSGAPSE